MSQTQKSHVLSGLGAGSSGREVRSGRTPATLGNSRVRGAGATVWRKVFAGRSLAALVALATLAACDPLLQGNGVYAERPVRVGSFIGLWASNGVGAAVTVAGGAEQSVTITGDENLVADHIRWELVDPEPQGITSAAGKVLHVYVSPADFVPVIPPRVVITRPDLAFVRGDDGASLEVKRAIGSTATAGPLAAALDGASLDARAYPTSGAVVVLTAGSRAQLHSDGPVTGSVSADSRLDNTLGAGHCLVTPAGPESVTCH
jgi:hypothetical protein